MSEEEAAPGRHKSRRRHRHRPPLHWDGTGVVSQDVELTQDAEPAAGLVGRSRNLATGPPPAPPAPAIDRALAAALTLYLDAGLLRASVHPVIPGATGHLLWVPSPAKNRAPLRGASRTARAYALRSAPCALLELALHLPMHNPLHRHIALVLQAESDAEDVAGHLYAQALADALVVHFLRRYAASQGALGEVSGGLQPYKLQRTTVYIQTHLEEKLSLATLAAVAEMSPTHFARLFKQATGLTPHQYVSLCRIAAPSGYWPKPTVPSSRSAPRSVAQTKVTSRRSFGDTSS